MTLTAPLPPTAEVARHERGSSAPPSLPVGYGMNEALADMDAAVAGMLRVCAGVDVDAAQAWPSNDRQRMLRLFDQVVDGFTAGRGTFLVAEQRAGTWQGSGDRSFEAFRVRTAGVAPRSAAVQVRQAEHLATAPEAAAAVTDGTIGLEHAAVLAQLTATGSPAQREALAAGGQDELLGWAQEQDAGTFATTVARWAAEQDPDKLEADHQAQRRERFLTLATTPRGTVIRGLVDTMAGHRLTLALEAVTPRPAADDDRSPMQRSADALDTMATAILSSADTKPGAHVPPHVSLILSEETFVAARAHRDRQRAAEADGTDPHPDAGAGGYPPVTLEDGTPVPISEAAQILCDCAVTRVAVDADGAPLDLGRTQRLFSGEQRRAILARDRECIWPSCHMPARWLQIHHRLWWERDNGETNVENGVAICSFHHHETHRLDLTITRVGKPDEGPPRRKRRRTGEIAMATYEFRDPAGRVVATSAGGAEPDVSMPRPGTDGADDYVRHDEAAPEGLGARTPTGPSPGPGSDGADLPAPGDGPAPDELGVRRPPLPSPRGPTGSASPVS